MTRHRLPDRRGSETIVFTHDGTRYFATVSRYRDGKLAEIFLDTDRIGSTLSMAAKDLAVVASIALQHGVPVSSIRSALSQEKDGTMHGPLGKLFQILVEGRLNEQRN